MSSVPCPLAHTPLSLYLLYIYNADWDRLISLIINVPHLQSEVTQNSFNLDLYNLYQSYRSLLSLQPLSASQLLQDYGKIKTKFFQTKCLIM
jgi:hypothetical protein